MENNQTEQLPVQQTTVPLAKARKKIFFTGNFWDYFFKTLGLLILTVITVGLMVPYFAWWQAKYFVNHLEVEA